MVLVERKKEKKKERALINKRPNRVALAFVEDFVGCLLVPETPIN
jgi:hypothetical protein